MKQFLLLLKIKIKVRGECMLLPALCKEERKMETQVGIPWCCGRKEGNGEGEEEGGKEGKAGRAEGGRPETEGASRNGWRAMDGSRPSCGFDL